MNDYLWVIRGSKVRFDQLETQGSEYLAGSVFTLPDYFIHPDYWGGGCMFLGGAQKGTYLSSSYSR